MKNLIFGTFLLPATLLLVFVFFCEQVEFRYQFIVFVASTFLWLPNLLSYRRFLSKEEKTFVNASIFMLFLITLNIFMGRSHAELIHIYRNVATYVCGIISVYAINLLETKKQIKLFYGILAISIICFVLCARQGVALVDMEGEAAETSQLGHAWFSSLVMIVNGISLVVFLFSTRRVLRVICICSIALALFINFSILQRATNVLLTFVLLSSILAFRYIDKSKVKFMVLFLLGFILFVYQTNLYIVVLEYLSTITPDRVSRRLDELNYSLQMSDMQAGGGTMASREVLIANSWASFTSSFGTFLFGVGDVRNSDIIGRHSFLVDNLARYGIVGGIGMYYYFKSQYQILMKYCHFLNLEYINNAIVIIFFIYIFRDYFGIITMAPTNLLMLIFIPSSIILLTKENYKL